MEPIIIVLTGPESSGKSALCQALSKTLNCPWVSEYAREFLEDKGTDYDYETLIEIYQGHLKKQHLALKNNPKLILFDTDSINYKVWSQRVFGKVPEDIEKGMQRESTHHYLICYPDLAWEPDRLRENPHDRKDIFNEHQQLIVELERPFQIVKGQKEERLKNSLAALQRLVPSLFSAD